MKYFKYIKESVDINSILKEFDITISDLNNMLDFLIKNKQILEDYESYEDVLEDMKVSKSRNYINLRGWKIKNVLDRYNILKKVIDEADEVEDYLLELEDHDYKLIIHPKNRTIKVIFEQSLKKFSYLFNFLEKNQRVGFQLIDIKLNDKIEINYDDYDDEDDNDEATDRLFRIALQPNASNKLSSLVIKYSLKHQ